MEIIILLIVGGLLCFFLYGLYDALQTEKRDKRLAHTNKLYELRKELEALRVNGDVLNFLDKRYWVILPYIHESHLITFVKPDPFHPTIPNGGVMVFGMNSRTVAILPEKFSAANAQEITSLLKVTVGQRTT